MMSRKGSQNYFQCLRKNRENARGDARRNDDVQVDAKIITADFYFNIVIIYHANSSEKAILLIKSIDSVRANTYYLRRSEGKGYNLLN